MAINGVTNVRTTLVGDADTELTFSPAIQNISIAVITASVTNPVFVKLRAALTGANAAAWVSDTAAYKLTSAVRAMDIHTDSPVSSIHIGSATAEEVQWAIYKK
jgi:hypothetical protein